ncbi:Zinc finger protein 300 [Araneus ventricosus]|uniref:Zinc finger protein 300 n=1 Tax=Araneus ventricosus TaxID=182803 RepID=A0A4Y2UVW1_ARAVE|nr:Zinc finger protein 300 [Araneus ventricosus]
MAVLPPLEKILLQSRESDADTEMSSSSASDEDALEYNMSEDLEDSPAVINPPPPSKPEKANKYKNRSHTGEKPFRCVFCVKSFSHEAHMIVHRRIHHQREPYVCQVGNNTFLEKSYLEQHFKLHKGERKYKGRRKVLPNENDSNLYSVTSTQEASKNFSISNKGFSKNSGSNRPAQSHAKKKLYLCNACGKSFSQKCNLRVHYRVHTKEKPFVCDTCGKAYTRNHNLKLHHRVHKERPFACDACEKAFGQVSKLNSHYCLRDK